MPALPDEETPSHAPSRFFGRLKEWSLGALRAIAPSPTAWWGATVAVALVSLAVWVSVMWDTISPASVAGPLLVGTAIALVAVLGTGLLILVLAVFRRAPLHFRWTALSGVLLLALSCMLVPIGALAALAIVFGTLAVAALFGGAVAMLTSGRWRRSGKFTRVATIAIAFVGTGCVGAAGVWLARSGSPRADLPVAAQTTGARIAPPSLSDPAKTGPHDVHALTYGAGTDRRRPEFAAGAALRTKPVDASEVLKGWSGVTGWARTRFWGFDAKSLPLNGRIWYPAGDGPFPLVLVVHGNHLAADFSDPGYEYLGRLLASRGYIAVSVDENFLNSMETDLFSGLEGENNTRGWLLLEHLRVWHAWNADEKCPFYRKVDTQRIALVGHSRGGEAVAHAAAFNRLSCNPDNAKARFDYGYHIRSIVAIAPADGQYRPAGTRTPVADVDYFTIQGSHDSDVSSFYGLLQYDRVTFGEDNDGFKSAVYVYGANHGQFNTSWGTYDVGAGLPTRIVNTAALLDAADQRRILEVYLSAFLECTLRDVSEYRPLFQDARYGAAWLPKTVYLTQYADATMKALCTFDDDIDLSTTSVAGGKIAAENLTLWRETRLPLRHGPNEDRAVFLGWDRQHEEGEPSYEIAWPKGAFDLDEHSVLSFCLADADEDPTPDDDGDEPTKDDGKPRQPIDLSIELTDATGHTARLPLSHVAPVQPQIETAFLKAALLQSTALSEPIFQTYLFPLADFRAAGGEFNPAEAMKLRLVFDRTEAGVVIFDKAAFGTPR